jgi:methylated-DNA-[protein]-cysteine S-methyltransferase
MPSPIAPAPTRTIGDLATPLGRVLVITDGPDLVGLYFDEHERTPAVHGLSRDPTKALLKALAQLEEYFAGTREVFDLPLRPAGTPFQRDVWNALVAMKPGTTASYGAIAAQLGRPQASRAVGAANGRNPISIVIPCHRLVGTGGNLTGYGWGLERKQWLLEHERAMVAAHTASKAPRRKSDRGERDLDGVAKAGRDSA